MRCAPVPARVGLAVLCALVAVAACTSSAGHPAPAVTSTSFRTVTRSATPSSIAPSPSSSSADPAPVVVGPTTSAQAGSCPFVATGTAVNTFGTRLDRVTVQRSGGSVVGCRLYALEHPNDQCSATCLAGENLPPANQPVIEMAVTTYRSAQDAHNAFVLTAERGTQPLQFRASAGNVGVCYQAEFWSKDKGKDWACAFSTGMRAVVVRTVDTTEEDKAATVTKEIAQNL